MKELVAPKLIRQPLAILGLLLGSCLGDSAQAQVVTQVVVINEILCVNRSTLFPDLADEAYTPAYVELYNNSDVAINLGNDGGKRWSISDTTNSLPSSFFYFTNAVIPPRGFLLLYLDSGTNATTPPGIHVGNKNDVRDSGDDFNLYNGNLVLADRIVFGMQLMDASLGRVTDGAGGFGSGFALMKPTPGTSNNSSPIIPSITSITNLWINEWMTDGSPDWFEIFNRETNIVNISGISFYDNTLPRPSARPLPQFSFIAANGFLKFIADDLSGGANEWDHVPFKLARTADEIWMMSSNAVPVQIDKVDTGSLTGSQTAGRLPDGSTNIVRPLGVATPEDSNFQLITNLVINEVLPHTDPPFEDAIEFYNPTAVPAPIGGFWLSNSRTDAMKYRIPTGTVVPAYGYKVFYEYIGGPAGAGFNTDGSGTDRMFTLNSARGDEVYLYSASNNPAGTLTGSRLSKAFEASANGVSFGRYIDSQTNVHFVAMSQRTFGQDNPANIPQFRLGTGTNNASPKIGPLAINEIMYHPPDIRIGTNILDDSLNEYIEIYNATPTNVFLYDPVNYGYANGLTNTWRLRGQVDFQFPTNVTLGPGAYLILVNFNPAVSVAQSNTFCGKYGVPSIARLFGQYSGKLSNSGGSIELYRPDPPQAPDRPDAGLVPQIRVDEVDYRDTAPWPTEVAGFGPDGFGRAIQRIKPEEYANDPVNWRSAPPTPGRQEPHEPFSISARLEGEGGSVVIGFLGQPFRTYTVQYKPGLETAGGWSKFTDLAAQPTTSMRYVTNSVINGLSRFYRVVTPAQ